ncbi:MAG: fibronectin type III domain-containing protein [Bacteroidales bacterium]|nr:fibronectin type III domain-containing protein [Bacteroidales bacterium]
MVPLLRSLTACVLMLAAVAGSAKAQDKPYVIVKDGHYLAHVETSPGVWAVQDVTTFGPNCLWLSGSNINPSGTNHNYYFDDGVNYRFLMAPLEANGELELSASQPITSLLRNTDQSYYFYDWDADSYGRGVARGHWYSELTVQSTCEAANHQWSVEDGQCWDVFWVAYSGGWTTSSNSYDLPEATASRFRLVTVEEHAQEVSNETGGIAGLTDFSLSYVATPLASHTPGVTVSNYSYDYIAAYTTYTFGGTTHNYWGDADHGTSVPDNATSSGNTPTAYLWTLTGDGAAYLSFEQGSNVLESTSSSVPTVYYRTENNEGHKTATLTLTVTYSDGSTQTRTAEITVNTPCQSPVRAAEPVVNYEEVIVSWVPTATSYKVYWQEQGAGEWESATVGDVTSYAISGLSYNTTYNYKVAAFCSEVEQSVPGGQVYEFTTKETPGLLIYGAVFGGGRMADVTGNTEVVIINCDSISAVYGGNDILGEVKGSNGATIALGVNSGDSYDSYGTTTSNFNIGSVYGGGNGYYAYNGTYTTASYNTTYTLAENANVNAMTRQHQIEGIVWTNNTGAALSNKTCPKIKKTNLRVRNNYVYVDSLFGGAKNAILSDGTNDVTITLDGGTIYAVFGGNNWGGSLGYNSHEYITVNATKTDLTPNISNTARTGYGRDFGVRYLFGGGNKVTGYTSHITVNGGQVDTLFGGGNQASVNNGANILVNCTVGDDAGDGKTFGNTYTQAISSYSAGTITAKETPTYAWDGTGVYNVRTLFGGNNAAPMDVVPTVTLTSGSAGTVYGGGNAGDMLAQTSTTIKGQSVKYGTHVTMSSANMLVDNLYGGCQQSNVDYSTWVELQNGHVGTVYGGCNISGDVGSTKIYLESSTPRTLENQAVQGGTYVVATGGTVYKNLFAGSNGYYHCNNGEVYTNSPLINYDDAEGLYFGLAIPTHNETHVYVSEASPSVPMLVKGNVYAGGNLAPVGFDDNHGKPYPVHVGMASVSMEGGTVNGDVYGGGNMASVYGSNEVWVSGGTIGGALYGGNDRIGQVADMTNRLLDMTTASDGETSLGSVATYVKVTGSPTIGTVFGGGNGDYGYTFALDGIDYCDATDKPIQSNTFVDINLDESGTINTVYGGGNGVTVTGTAKVFLNVVSPTLTRNHVGTIYGGNNKGNLALVPDVILLSGQVGDVYGGCNQGAMTGSVAGSSIDASLSAYTGLGSIVWLRSSYNGHTPNFTVSGNVYAGCNMNSVTNNTLVLMEHGTVQGAIFGGSNTSGTVSGNTNVVVTGGTVGDGTTDDGIYGGGKGQLTGVSGDVNVTVGPMTATSNATSQIPYIYGDIYGGSALGAVNTNTSNTTTVEILNAHIVGNVYGGGQGAAVLDGNGYISSVTTQAVVNGNVHVKIGDNAGQTETQNYVTIDGSVFGCNNLAGTPKGTVSVDVYRTDKSYYPNPEPTTVGNITPQASWAIGKVYGGGNLANYVPTTPSAPAVHVYNCYNTIEYVYGGGNAASVPATNVTIDGGRFGKVFGGGNGEGTGNPGADIGGDVRLVVNGGIIDQLFGGSNTKGTISGTTNLNVTNVPLCTRLIKEIYGSGNLAPSTGDIVVNIPCGSKLKDVYGCSNQADHTGNVTINVFGGTIDRVFGGAKNADIKGNVTVNIFSGNINEVFGGNNEGGYIFGELAESKGNIVVNIDIDNAICPSEKRIGYVYGGGNDADYRPDVTGYTTTSGNYTFDAATFTNQPTRLSPEVNVISGTVDVAVFGGAKGDVNAATMQLQANPVTTIGATRKQEPTFTLENPLDPSSAKTYTGVTPLAPGNYVDNNNVVIGAGAAAELRGNVFGGGNAAKVTGSTKVLIRGNNTSVENNVYGGGNAAKVTGSTDVKIGE